MSEDLYHAAIMKHAARAAGDRRLSDPDASATVDNPLCGDRVTVDVRLDGERIADIGYRVRGCALCQASAAVIADAAAGATTAEASTGEAELRAMLAGSPEASQGRWAALAIFRPVCEHASRHDCVLLPFAALAEVLRQAAAEPR